MYRNILKISELSAVQKNISFIKGWKDSFGNIILIAEIGGRKHAFQKDKTSQDWSYFYGIGAKKITPDMPAGRADFIIEQKVEPQFQLKITELLNTVPESNFKILKNKSEVSWSPSSEEEKLGLANLVNEFVKVNSYLSQIGHLYTGGDMVLYGEKISGDDILKYKIPTTPTAQPTVTTPQPQVATSVPSPKPGAESEGERPAKQKSSSSGIFGGSPPKWITNEAGHGYEVGPQHHQGRSKARADRYKEDPEKNWYSDNAWDVLSPAGTKIYSLTNGRVSSIKDSSSSAPNIYGTQVIVRGETGYPDIFYTHTDSVVVSVGDIIRVGDQIAQIGMPKTKEMPHHVHIGLPPGVNISSLMNRDGSFVSSKSSKLVS